MEDARAAFLGPRPGRFQEIDAQKKIGFSVRNQRRQDAAVRLMSTWPYTPPLRIARPFLSKKHAITFQVRGRNENRRHNTRALPADARGVSRPAS